MAPRPTVLGGDDPERDGLVGRARAGDSEAWTEIYGLLAPAVAGYLRLRGARDVGDLTSETFLGVFRGIGGFSGSWPRFRSWVFVIAHRRLQDERRRLARHRAEAGIGVPSPSHGGVAAGGPVGDVEDDALARLGAADVRVLCERLAPEQADVLVLRILGDLTVEQVAEVVGKTPGAVKQLQRRGLAALRQLTASGPYPSGALRR